MKVMTTKTSEADQGRRGSKKQRRAEEERVTSGRKD
jgi:hypothetical protein